VAAHQKRGNDVQNFTLAQKPFVISLKFMEGPSLYKRKSRKLSKKKMGSPGTAKLDR